MFAKLIFYQTIMNREIVVLIDRQNTEILLDAIKITATRLFATGVSIRVVKTLVNGGYTSRLTLWLGPKPPLDSKPMTKKLSHPAVHFNQNKNRHKLYDHKLIQNKTMVQHRAQPQRNKANTKYI